MTVIQPAGTGAEPADSAMLTAARPLRTTFRGAAARGVTGAGVMKPEATRQPAPPFEAELLVAARDLPDSGGWQGDRGSDPGLADDEDTDAPVAQAPLGLAAVGIEQLLPGAPGDRAPAGPAGQGSGARADVAPPAQPAREPALLARKPDSAETNMTAGSAAGQPAGLEPVQPAAGPSFGAADARPSPGAPPAPGLDALVAASIDAPDRARSVRTVAGRSTEPAARRDGAAAAASQPGFRLEPAGPSAGGVADVRAGTARAPGEAPLPADILVAGAGGGTAGLDVTIAAATPELRDRFRAATDELLADLAAIGTEVDAIRVELRGELADGGSGAGAGEDGAARGDIENLQTGWGELDAAARIDRADATEAGEATAEPDAQSAQDSSGQMAGGDRDRQAGRGAGFDLERLRLVPQSLPARAAGAAGAGTASGALNARIDRYA